MSCSLRQNWKKKKKKKTKKIITSVSYIGYNGRNGVADEQMCLVGCRVARAPTEASQVMG